MTTTGSWWVTTIFVPLVLLVVGFLYYRYWLKQEVVLERFKKQGIPSCAFHPYFGNIPEIQQAKKLAAKETPSVRTSVPFFDIMDKNLGPTYTYCFGPSPRLVTSDPALIRQILVSKDESFTKVSMFEEHKALGGGLSVATGDKWNKRRGIMNALLLPKDVREIVLGVMGPATEAVARWQSLIGSQPSAEFDMHEELTSLALSTAGRIVLGADVGGTRVAASKLLPLFCQYLESVPKWVQSRSSIPGFRFLPSSTKAQLKTLEKQVTDLTLNIVNRRKVAKKLKESIAGSQLDILELMVRVLEDEKVGTEAKEEGNLSIQEITEECLSFIASSYETNAALLTWTVFLLAKYPTWQDEVRMEVLEATGGDPSLAGSPEALEKMIKLGWVIQETLRLFPPIPLLVRRCSQDTSLVGLKVPEGVDIILPLIQLHRRVEIWGEDAEDFKPPRFETGNFQGSMRPMAFLPFGVGPQCCPGHEFVESLVKVLLASLLARFKWRLAMNYRHCPHVGGNTLKPKHGMPVVLEKLEL